MKIYEEDIVILWRVHCGNCLTKEGKLFVIEQPLSKPFNGKITEEVIRCERCIKDLPSIAEGDETFRYQLLSRLKMDCDYFLGNGQRLVKHLWALDVQDHIKYMKELYHSLPERPEWITYEDILDYERRMTSEEQTP